MADAHNKPVNPPSAPAPAPAPQHFKNQQQRDAFQLMKDTLASWGLSDLVGDLRRLIIAGDTSPDTLSLALSQTKAYEQRFGPVNDLRRTLGLSDMRPADIVATEEQYRNVMQAYGLPSGFYDDRQSIDKLLGYGVSPSELQARVQVAHDQYMNAPDYIKNLWSTYFGYSKGDVIASILDPEKATQVIQDRAQQIQIGGAAAQVGLSVGAGRAQQLQQAGVTLSDAQKAYAQIAQSQQYDKNIAQRFGTTFDQSQEENDLLLHDASAAQKRQTLYSEEESLFNKHGAIDSNALGVSQEA